MSKATNTWSRALVGWDSPLANPYFTKPNQVDKGELRHNLFIEMKRIRRDIDKINSNLANGCRILKAI